MGKIILQAYKSCSIDDKLQIDTNGRVECSNCSFMLQPGDSCLMCIQSGVVLTGTFSKVIDSPTNPGIKVLCFSDLDPVAAPIICYFGIF